MLYRVKQFYWALTCSFKQPNYEFIKKYLKHKELELFCNLSISEQFHCIRVAENAIKYAEVRYLLSEQQYEELIRICLLHDIGKINYKINTIEKSIIVILSKLFNKKLKQLTNSNKKIREYYFHADYGADILKEIGCSEDIVYIVRNHHSVVKEENIFLEILKYSDNIS